MATTNKNLKGMNLLQKLAKTPQNTATALQKFGAGVKQKYQGAESKWESSPRYKKSQKSISLGNF